jgi:hypothetical protein
MTYFIKNNHKINNIFYHFVNNQTTPIIAPLSVEYKFLTGCTNSTCNHFFSAYSELFHSPTNSWTYSANLLFAETHHAIAIVLAPYILAALIKRFHNVSTVAS